MKVHKGATSFRVPAARPRGDGYQWYRNAVIRMRHVRGEGLGSGSVAALDEAIRIARLAERRFQWREAAQTWITAAYVLAEDEEYPEAMEELLARGRACLDRAEAEEPFEPMGEGI
jgi:hypothetical protein